MRPGAELFFVSQRSGNSDMDSSVEAALRGVRKIAPIPAGLSTKNIERTIRFTLD